MRRRLSGYAVRCRLSDIAMLMSLDHTQEIRDALRARYVASWAVGQCMWKKCVDRRTGDSVVLISPQAPK